MNEREFISKIDCRFPYTDEQQANGLIATACSISSNAAFAIGYELGHPGRNADVPFQNRIRLLQVLQDGFSHPLKSEIIGLVEDAIRGRKKSLEDALTIMRKIAPYPGEYCALSIACFSCDDVDGIADELFNGIAKGWQQR
jgi:hypothetical protein